MSAVNQVTKDGSPDFLVQDVPPRSVAGLEIDQPRIYYGEVGTDYTLVKTEEREFDYPGAAGDVFTEYEGTGGIPISGFFNKLAFAWRERTIKFFTTSAIDDDSRVHHPQQHRRPGDDGGAVPGPRRGPVHGDRRQAPVLDPGRVHDDRPVSLRDARGRPQLHPQLGQGGDRRVRRDDALLRLRRRRPAAAAPTARIFPDLFTPADEIPRRAVRPRALPRGPLHDAGARLRDLPRRRSRRCSTTRATSGRSPRTCR